MYYSYPLSMSFKVFAFGPQIHVRDGAGKEIFYVHMKALKLREDIRIYSDSTKAQEIFSIKTPKIIDFSATYHIADSSSGTPLGAVKRHGMKSLWRASYDILSPDGQQVLFTAKEDNPWVRVLDTLMREIPIVSLFTGYMFNPSYTIFRSGSETPAFQFKKEPAFLEGKFSISATDTTLDVQTERLILLSIVMMTLMERWRG